MTPESQSQHPAPPVPAHTHPPPLPHTHPHAREHQYDQSQPHYRTPTPLFTVPSYPSPPPHAPQLRRIKPLPRRPGTGVRSLEVSLAKMGLVRHGYGHVPAHAHAHGHEEGHPEPEADVEVEGTYQPLPLPLPLPLDPTTLQAQLHSVLVAAGIDPLLFPVPADLAASLVELARFGAGAGVGAGLGPGADAPVSGSRAGQEQEQEGYTEECENEDELEDSDPDPDIDVDVDPDMDDRLAHQGNTKKRKVPSVHHHHAHPHSSLLQPDGDADETQADGLEPGMGMGTVEVYQPPSSPTTSPYDPCADSNPTPEARAKERTVIRKKAGKLLLAARAGVARKEVLRARKRQLGGVFGRGEENGEEQDGDEQEDGKLAVEQALEGLILGGGTGPRVRLSKRRNVRIQRGVRMQGRHPDQVPFPVLGRFEFGWECKASERMRKVGEEVGRLRKRIDEELVRQARAGRRKGGTEGGGSGGGGRKAARRGRRSAGSQAAEFLDPVTGEVVRHSAGDGETEKAKGKGTKKKKKRSALANASNPHHLRNYVPSRLPFSSQAAHQSAADLLSPIPVRFLSADMRTRGSAGQVLATTTTTTTTPGEEWICAFCEYELFFGDEVALRRAVRARKKVLRRRRRARERAARGVAAARVAEAEDGGGEDTAEGPEETAGPGRASGRGETEEGPGVRGSGGYG
ncbi:hypothetical protein C0995_006217 [Termitomyces sp. Mi166|nr:hypothetical protein C0995_006217 [Termitomyces sp. Mi166\